MSDELQPPPTPPPFSCEVTREHDTAVVRLLGELDLDTTPILQAKISDLRETGTHILVLDLSRLAFMDSTGLRCILDCDAEARNDGFSIALIEGPPAVHRVFELTNTHTHLRFIAG
jgi:anti-sigma B factor antagonist